MMKLGKRIKALVVICMVIFSVGALSASSVLASSKYDVNYESTYDMTGGLYTRSSLVSKGKDICIAIAPTAGTSGCSMGIRLQKYDSDSGKWKDVRSEKYVDSAYGGNVKFKDVGKGKYRIYLRNYSNMSAGGKGFRWTGGISVKFK